VTNKEAKWKWGLTGLHTAAVAAAALWCGFDTGHCLFSILATLSGVVAGFCLGGVVHCDYEGQ
jgi:hypothetical protein